MRKTALLFALSLTVLSASAQNTFRSAYFMDGYLYAHSMNPAFYANRNYIGLGVGNVGVQTQSNLGVSTFFYPAGSGSTVNSFLSDAVSASQFLGKLRRHNTENINAQLDVVNFGFWTKRNQFHNFSLSVHVIESAAAPYDLFRFLKEGSTNGNTYDLSGFSARGRAYAQAAYGISMPIEGHPEIRVGGKAKVLVGLVYADMRFNRFDVTMTGDRWTVDTDGTLRASNIPAAKTQGSVPISDVFDLDSFDPENMRPSGIGTAIDFGATWQVLPWLELSGSVTDLGFIHWKQDVRMGTTGTWEYAGFDNIPVNGDNSYQDQLDRKIDELDELTRFHDTQKGSPFDFLPVTVYLGAEARANSWFTGGLLATARVEGPYSWAEIRASGNVEPAHWFGLSGSAAYGSFGPKLGAALNLRMPVLALFVGAELSSLKFVSNNPNGNNKIKDILNGDSIVVPRDNLNLNLAVGLNFTFGKTAAKRLHPTPQPEQ